MIMHADGSPRGRRYSVGFIGSLIFHVVLAGGLLWQASMMPPAEPFDPSGGSGRYAPRHASAVVRAGRFGGDPTGTDGLMMRQPSEPEAPWAVRQARQLQLRIAIRHVIDHVWQSTLFAVAIGLLTLAFRRNRARVRYALWFGVSAKFLLPFSVIMWCGSIIGSFVLTMLGPVDSSGAPGLIGSSAGAARALISASWSWLDALVRHPWISGMGQWLTETGTLVLWPSTFTMTEVTVAWLGLALLAIWTCGFAAIVFSRSRLSGQIWDVARTARRVELLDVKAPARLQIGLADGLLEPGVIGWFRPVLLLPADIEQHLTRPEIEAIVAHELCHVRRFDNMTAAIHMLVEAIFWFHPLVWWLGARLVDERERACDEHVLRTLGAPGPYAHGILNVCKRYVASPIASVSGVGSAKVRQRIDAILANRIGETTSVGKRVMLSGLVGCVLVVPLAAGALQAPPVLAPSPAAGTPPSGATVINIPAATAYALIVARADGQLGPALRRTATTGASTSAPAATVRFAAGDARSPRQPHVGPGEIAADAISASQLATLLAGVLGRGVEDRTGLSGDFTVRLTWSPDARGSSLFAAVEQQLGLRLVPLSTQAR